MDFHALSRRDLQALAKRNGVRANMTNGAMADALAALPAVDGIEEYVQQPVAEATPAAEPDVEEEAAPEEEEEPQAVIVLDDSEEEEKDLMPDHEEEKAPAGRRRATRRARVEPVAAPATRKRAAASKAEKADAAVEAVPARAARARSQKKVSFALDEAPEARPTSRRAVAKKTGDVSDEGAEEMEEAVDAQNEEDNAPVEEQSPEHEGETEKEDAAAKAVPTRATRARSQKKVSFALDEAPMTRTSRRALARKTGTEQEEEETQGDVSDEGAQEMEEAMDAQNEEQNVPVEEHSQEEEVETEEQFAPAEAVPARATRARSHRTGVSAAAEEAPKARRTSRRAVVRKAVPAPVSSDERGHDAKEMEAAVDARSEEQFEVVEAVPARATRGRRQRTVVSAAEDEAPKSRRTSRRTATSKTSTEQEVEEKATQDDVSDVEAAVPAPVSSDEAGDGAEEMVTDMDAQKEEQFVAAEAAPARTTRTRRQRTVVSVAEEEAPKTRRTSRRAPARKASAEQEVEQNTTQCDVSDVEDAVPAPVSSDGEADGSEEMEVATDAQNEEQNEQVGEQSQEEQGAVVDIPAPVEEEPPVAEDCMVDSSVEEQLVDVQQFEGSPVVLGLAEQEGSDIFQDDAVSTEGIDHASEDTEMVPVDQVLLTPLKSGEATHASEENEVPTSEEVLQSSEKTIDEQEDMAADVVTSTDVSVEDMAGHKSEECEDCTTEDESSVAEDVDSPVHEAASPVAEDIDSPVQESLVGVQQCEATEEIHLAGEDTKMVPVEETEDFTVEEEPPVAEHVDSSVQEPLFVQQCEATDEIQLAGEDTEMVPVNEVPQAMVESLEATEEVVFTSDVSHASEENEVPTSEVVLQSAGKTSEEQQDMAADEVPHKTDELVEEGAVVATEEMQQRMYDGDLCNTVDNLSQATVTDDEGAVKENGFSCDLIDVSIDEDGVVAADEMPQWSAAMQGVVEVVTVDSLSQATVTDELKETCFSTDLADVSIDEAIDGMPLSLATMDESSIQEEVFTEDEAAVTMDESVEELVTVENLSQATVTDDEHVKESVFSCGLSVLSVDEEEVMAADEMQLSPATMIKSVEELVFVDNPSQTTVTDDEWAVNESAFAGDCTPVVGTARDFSEHIASPFSANVFEAATKSLSMDSITVKPMVSEPADVPLFASEPVPVQRENEVKVPEAAFGKIIHSPLTLRKLRMAVAQANEADAVPLSVRKPRMAVEAQANEAGGVFGKFVHSPLTIRKLRMAVAQANEADAVPLSVRKPRMAVAQANQADGAQPLCIFSVGEENSAEPVAVERENASEALGSLRKLRTEFNQIVAVAQENEVKEGEKSSVPLDKLSLRKLKLKLKETLNAQKNMEPKRVALGRLDENVC